MVGRANSCPPVKFTWSVHVAHMGCRSFFVLWHILTLLMSTTYIVKYLLWYILTLLMSNTYILEIFTT